MLLGGEKMDDLKIGVEDEISQRMRVESSDVVRSCRPRGGGNRPQVVARQPVEGDSPPPPGYAPLDPNVYAGELLHMGLE